MAMKRCSSFPKVPHHWNLTIRSFRVISQDTRWGEVSYPFAEVQSVYSTAQVDRAISVRVLRIEPLCSVIQLGIRVTAGRTSPYITAYRINEPTPYCYYPSLLLLWRCWALIIIVKIRIEWVWGFDDLKVCIFVVSDYYNSLPQLFEGGENDSDTRSRGNVLWFNILSC